MRFYGDFYEFTCSEISLRKLDFGGFGDFYKLCGFWVFILGVRLD
jgi:hypothetical protein